MYITLHVGPMFSGKSTVLLTSAQNSINALCLRPRLDTRSGNSIKTHTGLITYAVDIDDCVELPLTGTVCIDEGHFCADKIIELIHKAQLVESAVDVHIALLTGTFKQTGWGSRCADLYALADSIYHLTAMCSVCSGKAPFTIRTTNVTDTVAIGGADMYSPRCRMHL